MSDCSICVEPFNKSTRKPVKCGQCAFTVCTQCFEHYQSDHSGLYNVHCLSCKELWEDQFVRENVPASVLHRLTASTKKRLRDEETAFMPDTQMYVEYGRGVETVKLNEYLEIHKTINDLQLEFAQEEMKKKADSFQKTRLRKRILDCKHSAAILKNNIYAWRTHHRLSIQFKDIMPAPLYQRLYGNNQQNRQEASHKKQPPPEPTVLCPCPAENCRGFVTRNSQACGVCDQKVCRKCLVPTNDNEPAHVCNDTDIQTAAFVLKTSKPCPKCAARIHKIEGCDQMWCTNCSTPFSWRTGQTIVGAVIHNPHYYEWMRSRNNPTHVREFGNNCEGLPDGIHLSRHLDLVFRENRDFTNKILSCHRVCVHHQQLNLRQEERPRMEADLMRVFMRNFDIRMKWLQNEITDNAFEIALHKRFKSKLVTQRVHQVFDLFITLCSDVFHRILRTNEDTLEIVRAQFLTELREIGNYTNTCFEKLARIYKVTFPRVYY